MIMVQVGISPDSWIEIFPEGVAHDSKTGDTIAVFRMVQSPFKIERENPNFDQIVTLLEENSWKRSLRAKVDWITRELLEVNG